MGIRRVITGHTSEGKASFTSDTIVEPTTVALSPGAEYYYIWGADETPTFPDDGSPYPYSTYFPPVGGFRFYLFTVPPVSVPSQDNLDIETALKEIDEKLPGSLAYMERDNPGMHTTDTIDYEYIISGEVWLELDNGEEVHLKAGDTVIQNGTRHAWRNKGAEPCRIVVCLVGAHRK